MIRILPNQMTLREGAIVSSFIANFQSPFDLDDLEWYYQRGVPTNLDRVLDASQGVPLGLWSVPKWARPGDRAFFMCATTAKSHMAHVCKQVKDAGRQDLLVFTEKERKLYGRYASHIIAMGRVAATPFPDSKASSWAPWLAPIRDFVFLENTIDRSEWKPRVKVSNTGSITKLTDRQLTALEEMAMQKNPEIEIPGYTDITPAGGHTPVSVTQYACLLGLQPGMMVPSIKGSDGKCLWRFEMSRLMSDFERSFLESGLLDKDYDMHLREAGIRHWDESPAEIDVGNMDASTVISIVSAAICDNYLHDGVLYRAADSGLLDRCLRRLIELEKLSPANRMDGEGSVPTPSVEACPSQNALRDGDGQPREQQAQRVEDAPEEASGEEPCHAPALTLQRPKSIVSIGFTRNTRRFLLRLGIKTADKLEKLDADYLACNGASSETIDELRPYITACVSDPEESDNDYEQAEEELQGPDAPEITASDDAWAPVFRHVKLEDFLENMGIDEETLFEGDDELNRVVDCLIGDDCSNIAIHSPSRRTLETIAIEASRAYAEWISEQSALEVRLKTPIEELPFNNRVKNVASHEGLVSVGDLCDAGKEAFANYRGVGSLTIRNVEEVLSSFDNRLASAFRGEASLTSWRADESAEGQINQRLDEYLFTLRIDVGNLSTRARHCLTIAGLDSIGAILEVGEAGLCGVRNTGRHTAAEIFGEAWRQAQLAPRPTGGINDVEHASLSDVYSQQSDGTEEYEDPQPPTDAGKAVAIRSHLIQVAQYALISPLMADRFIEANKGDPDALQNSVIDSLVSTVLRENPWGLTSSEVLERVCAMDGNGDEGVVSISLNRLQTAGSVYLKGELWDSAWMGLGDAVSNKVEDARTRKILLARLSGETLEVIGSMCNLTRQGVSLICSKALDRGLLEGTRSASYLAILDDYDLSKDELMRGLGASEDEWAAAKFFVGKRRKGRKRLPAEKLLTDRSIPLRVRMSLEHEVYRDYVKVDGTYVRRTKLALMLHTLKTHGTRSALTDEELLALYRETIGRIGVADDPKLHVNERYLSNFRLQRCVISGYWKRLRYYDIDRYDLDELVSRLGLEEFENEEISTRFFTITHPDLLKEYDIEDAYELHNVLRIHANDAKARGNSVPYGMTRRMPIITVGHASRSRQVRELARELSPISVDDFARAYEEKYGVEVPTVLANYLPFVADYTSNGVISMDLVPFTPEEEVRMRGLLTQDLYELSQVERLYKGEFPKSGSERVNSLSLRRLGFRVNFSYALRDTWKSLYEYLDSLLTNRDFIDEKSLPTATASSRQYENYRYMLMRNRRLLPYEGGTYITEKGLASLDITEDVLRDFIQQAETFCDQRGIGYCTSRLLMDEGFGHELLAYEMPDEFYTTVLCSADTRFTSLRCGGGKIACVDNPGATVAAMIASNVGVGESVFVDELVERIRMSLGIEIRRDKVLAAPTRTDLYYSAITDMIYKDKDTFIREVV